MADAFTFELVSPERQMVSGEASDVLIPGSEGYFQVFAHHAPLMSTVKPGVVEVTMADGDRQRYVVFGGFADVSPTGCTVLAEEAVNVADLDRDDLAEKIKDAGDDVADATDDNVRSAAQERLDHLKTLEAALR